MQQKEDKKKVFLTVHQIEQWANPVPLGNDVMFLGGRPELPYIKAPDGLLHYFTLRNNEYNLVMTSSRDLGSYPS